MAMIIKNQDNNNLLKIYISSGKFITIPAGGQIDLLGLYSRTEIANSDISYHIDQGNVILNDGVNDLNKLKALRIIYDVPLQEEIRDHYSGKLRVHQTSRQLGTKTYFTGSGDNPDDPSDIGNGNDFIFSHKIGDSTNVAIYLDFNCIENETWLHEGYVIWKNALFDRISLDIVSRVTNTQAGSNTAYNLYGGYLIIPSDGTNGTIDIISDITTSTGGLVYMTDTDTGEQPIAFWNAEWNSSTEKFENITPAPLGDGRYNMFATEICLGRFVNRIPFLNNGFEKLQSSDVDRLGHGMRLKAYTQTYIDEQHPDHDWEIACIIVLHREHIS